jgi:hypothetical protein
MGWIADDATMASRDKADLHIAAAYQKLWQAIHHKNSSFQTIFVLVSLSLFCQGPREGWNFRQPQSGKIEFPTTTIGGDGIDGIEANN